MISNRWELTPALAFVVFFAGVMLLGAVFQWIVLPVTPWHAGHGLMAGGDWVSFFDQARELAAQIRSEGWAAWELSYQGQWPASLMAVAFVLTGWEHPSAVLPVYAAVYGLTAAVFVRLAQSLGVSGFSLWFALAVLAFPSTVLIWGQPHKDAFALAGISLLVWSWSAAWLGQSSRRWSYVFMAVIVAIGLMWLPRPYLLDVVVLAFAGAMGVAVLVARERRRAILRAAVLIGMVCIAVVGFKKVEKVEKVELCDTWQPEFVIPFLHEKLGMLLCYRHSFIETLGGAASSLDHDRLLGNYRELLGYFPRAAYLAVVSPAPRWCSFLGQCETTSPGGEAKRLVASIEIIAFYVALLGWLGWFSTNNDRSVRALGIGLFSFAWSVALFYVLSSPNEGTLYRERFPEIALWWLGGVVGWSWILRSQGWSGKGFSRA